MWILKIEKIGGSFMIHQDDKLVLINERKSSNCEDNIYKYL